MSNQTLYTMNEWKIHPRWNKIYKLTNKKSGLSFLGVIVWKFGNKSVLIENTHGSDLINFTQCKQEYDIEIYTLNERKDNFPTYESSQAFMDEHLFQTEGELNRRILNRK